MPAGRRVDPSITPQRPLDAPWRLSTCANAPLVPPDTITRTRAQASRAESTSGALVHVDSLHARCLCRWSGARLTAPWRQPVASLSFIADRRVRPFARRCGRLGDMKHDHRLSRAILATIARSDARSPLFWWMVAHHDEIIAAAAGERIRWAAFCAEAARLGLTDTRGRPPTERNARETWRQARRTVARTKVNLETLAIAPSPKRPFPIAPDQQAPLLPPPPFRPATPPAANGAPTPAGSHILGRPDCRSPEEAQAEIDRVFGELAALDRRKFPFGCG